MIVNIQPPLISQQDLDNITPSLVDETGQDCACFKYNCYRSIDDESVMEVIMFESAAGRQAHMNSLHE